MPKTRTLLLRVHEIYILDNRGFSLVCSFCEINTVHEQVPQLNNLRVFNMENSQSS